VEEIMRIDGLDNVDIPSTISISPAVETLERENACKEKIAANLIGAGFNEIFTNSITNSAYYSEAVLQTSVKMINSLSAGLNIMRPSMMETGLESVAYNLNRKNNDLQFFEFGKTYHTGEQGKYTEEQHLSLYLTGKRTADGWKAKGEKADFFFVKALIEKITALIGIKISGYTAENNDKLDNAVVAKVKNDVVAVIGSINKKTLAQFDIKQPVFYADITWDKVLELNKKQQITYSEIPKYPAVYRDLAIVIDKNLPYEQVEKATYGAKVSKLQSVSLFDVFENEKLGADKKSLAVSFTFLDEEKTMTDKDIDAMMGRIIASYEKELNAVVRK
jgi:phenylalanyl-tRNA synthetase beta chain